MPNYWLMKSEPGVFSIDDLANCPNQTEHWDGVRNYQARNMMRDQMHKGDLVFFYHSSCKNTGIAGIAKVVKEAYPDHTALDPDSAYFDPKSTVDNPRWFMVDIRFVEKFTHLVSLQHLKENPLLKDLPLVQRGSRLSIMPVAEKQWNEILAMVPGR
ncbi:EVE domain-containing protein [Endozoicomonas sp. SM1973]|uniref:EVE domain-containing protein n=1 Tax=Spartinivicinus marinus TaxID=2994442 RepID=A0A853I3Q6_9GAMM|nr:EVE domain-containing protein [Spartinivicinus marinus]MCX4027156.1 EVE domain-containing protein [Spartinivicinus marinus]NYZ66122.1 EVE domain-containing protein [Spartinivicinus marinus]